LKNEKNIVKIGYSSNQVGRVNKFRYGINVVWDMRENIGKLEEERMGVPT
jgi:hypothetical protein